MVGDVSDHFEAQSLVMARAAEIEHSLAPEFPSFRKLMMRSHVTKGFWLVIPDICSYYVTTEIWIVESVCANLTE